jgi:type II secretory pathway pseudopilin PulG
MELIVSIGIIGVLAVIVIINVNPTKNLANARNAQRESDVLTLMNAVHQYLVDKGDLPATIPVVAMKEVCKSGDAGFLCDGGVRLEMLSGTYLSGIPTDPLAPSTGTGTRYWMAKDTRGRVTVIAAYAEDGKSIFLTR